MPESRDRRTKPVDIAAVFTGRRSGAIGILDDEAGSVLFGSTPSRVNTVSGASGEATGLGVMRAGGVVRGSFGNSRVASPTVDRNSPSGSAQRGRGRPSRSLLPSWYPRTPLRDVTAIVRAIERRRVRLGENQSQQPASPLPADQFSLDPSLPVSVFPLEQCNSATSPNQAFGLKLRTPAGSKLPKILLDITNQPDGGSEFLTPQKKLLNSIDMVEKVVREELLKLKRTPGAKKADREKRVRTLMSMR